MNAPTLTNAGLHHAIVRHIVDYGHAPEVDELAELFGATEEGVLHALGALQGDHGVVLHPDGARVWAIHPFALAPTNFVVRRGNKRWWGNCAWCSLGVAGLLGGDATITTTLGADGRQVEVHVEDDRVLEEGLVVHFPVPMTRAWDNVVYTCSTMLMFDDEVAIDAWCARWRIPKGDVQPVARVYAFAKAWYGRHLDPDWRKWTADEARALFAEHGLRGPIWEIPASTGRF